MIEYMVSNSLDNVSDGDVKNAVIKRMNLNSAADKSTTQRDRCRVDKIKAFTTEPRVRLVFHDERYVRCRHTPQQILFYYLSHSYSI